MTAGNYRFSLGSVLIHEGGKVDHPKDPGGRTAYGITQRVYDGFRDSMKLPRRDVWLISQMEVEAIYQRQYWNVIKADRLPKGVDYVVFDGAVHSGPSQSVKWLQRAINAAGIGTVLKVDGVIGEATLGAVAIHPDHDMLIASIIEQRLKFLKALKTWATFGKGWTNRIKTVLQAGQAQATGSVEMPNFVFIDGANTKATEDDLKTAPSQAAGAAITAAGLGIPQVLDGIEKVGHTLPVIKDALDQAKGSLLELVGTFPFLQPVIDNLTTIGATVAVAGLVWTFYGKAKAAFISDAANLKAA